jgi:hypothetical protein
MRLHKVETTLTIAAGQTTATGGFPLPEAGIIRTTTASVVGATNLGFSVEGIYEVELDTTDPITEYQSAEEGVAFVRALPGSLTVSGTAGAVITVSMIVEV